MKTARSEAIPASEPCCAATRRPAKRRSPLRRLAVIVLCTLIGVYLPYLLLLYACQTRLLFPGAYQEIPGAPVVFNTHLYPSWQRLERRDPAGNLLIAWYWPAPETAPASGLAVLLHGNFETAPCMQPEASFYHGLGMAVLVPEIRGYAGCGGKPGSQEQLAEDIAAWIDNVRQKPGMAHAKTVLHGRSIGGLLAAQAARHCRPDALVLQSSGHSAAELSWRFLAPPFLLRFPFRTGDVLAQGNWPTLIVHGAQDDIFPVSHAYANAKAAGPRGTLILVKNGTHNTTSIPRDGLEAFLSHAKLR